MKHDLGFHEKIDQESHSPMGTTEVQGRLSRD